jgi:hydrogenase expression/formation protein HypD
LFSLSDKKLGQEIISKIKNEKINAKFMHVCGTHQDTLVKHGLDILLKKCGLIINQGPGCPVCVTTPLEIEKMLLIAQNDAIVTCFGDMMNVPGEEKSLSDMKTEGYDVRTVYSIEDAVNIAYHNPSKNVVFMGIGFETTAPATAKTILNTPPKNFSILCCHRTMPYALKAILDIGEIKLDGLIEPGHVSTIIGIKPYEFISKDYGIPQVIAGFEPIDVLMSCWMLVKQIKLGKIFVENEYKRVVHHEGNIKAQKILNEVFEPCDMKWRGFPVINKSGLKIKKKFDYFDASVKFEDILKDLDSKELHEPEGCLCGELLRGLVRPFDCPLFGQACTPETPVGPCMVSVEGSCNIEYRYSIKSNSYF